MCDEGTLLDNDVHNDFVNSEGSVCILCDAVRMLRADG